MALPLYPQLKEGLEKMFLDLIYAASQQELGPFAESPRFTQHEGSSHSYNTVDGEERSTDYQEFMIEFELSAADFMNMELGDVIRLVMQQAREFGSQQSRYHYARLDQIIEEVGNKVTGPLTLDKFFEAIEQLFIPFDDSGNPQWPTLVINPNTAPRVRELAQAMETDEAKARLAEVIERKREQWDEEQSRRKLVD